jgi:fumarate reductase subunit C
MESMQLENKNQKISRLAAKTAIKVFIIVLVFGVLPFASGDQAWNSRLEQSHLVMPNKWAFVFPALLFVGFLVLMITCLKQKFKWPEYNWLFVLNTLILVIYLILFYTRLFKPLLA